MEAWHQATGQKLLAQAHSLLNAIVSDGIVIVFDRLNHVLDLLRYLQLGQFHKLPKGMVALYETQRAMGCRLPARLSPEILTTLSIPPHLPASCIVTQSDSESQSRL